MIPARPALTSRGWGVLAASAALLVAARLFGSAELAGLGAAAGGVVGAAAFFVRRAPMTYRAQRWLSPARVAVGDAATARVQFSNYGSRPTTGRAVADDPAGADAGGRCLIPPLAPRAVAEAAYGLPTERRGLVTLAPLAVSLADPFGLVEQRVQVAGPARLVVHPRIRPVLALPGSSTREARHGARHPTRSPLGDDFFALREYEVGDDLRRVHWRSTARLGDLMLRQDELRYGEVATVLVDTRAGAHRGDSFERALEVAASVAAALVDDGRRLRFLTTGGFDVELDGRTARARSAGQPGWAAVLDHLAAVAPHSARGTGGVPPATAPGAAKAGGDGFAVAVQSIGRQPSGPLAAVVGAATAAELGALGALRSRLGLVLITRCHADGQESAVSVPGAIVVSAGDIETFPEAWNQAVLSCGRREPVRP